MNIDVSIIIPVYNAEKFLTRCLESVQKQTIEEVEVLIIDDGSTDSSETIAMDFVMQDQRFKYYKKQNGGPMSACVFGLKEAQGKYVGFVDSDDTVDDMMFACLFNEAVENNADLACCGFKTICKNDEAKLNEIVVPSGLYDRDAIHKKIFPILFNTGRGVDGERALHASRWNKIYKRELLLGNIEFFDESIFFGEDLLLVAAAIMSSERILVLQHALFYNYYITDGSLSRKYVAGLNEQIDRLSQAFLNLIINKNATSALDGYYRDLFSFQIKKMRNELLSNESKKEKLEAINKILNSEYMSKSLPAVKNYYRDIRGKIKYWLVKYKKKRLLFLLLKITER